MADRIPLLPSDPLFIQDDLGYSPEVLSDMQAADVTFDPSLYPPLPPEEPDMIDFAKDRLIDVGQGFADIPGFVANYFVQPDEQGQPSFISPQEFGEDVKNVGMAMGQAIADDPVGFALDITPGISNVRAGMEANRLYQQANEQEAQGDEVGAAKTRSMASLTTTDMLNPVPTAFAVKAIFAGPMAQKAPQKLSDKRLDTLEEVSDDTLAQEVFGETGAFITPDGRRAFEIDTSKATVDTARLNNMYVYMRPDQEPRVLPEVLDFPELYENYPQLKETKIKLDGSIDGIANYNLATNTISINPNQAPPPTKGREGPLTSVVLHETQHAVQEIENYLRPEIFPQGFLAEPEYKGLPTEVEARNVQTRFENPEERKRLPISTMDLPPSLFSNVDLLRERRKNYPSNDFPPTVFNKNVRPPIQYDLPFDAQNRPRTTDPVPRNPIDQSRSDPYESPADTRDRQRRRKKRGYAEGGIVSLANGGAVEHGVVTL